MKNGILFFVLFLGLPILQANAKSLMDVYQIHMASPECQEASKKPVLIEYGETMLIKDGGRIEIALEPQKVVLKWGTTHQIFDFSNGEMPYKSIDPKTGVDVVGSKKCYEKTTQHCASLSKAYGNIFLQRPIEYLQTNPNVDHMNVAVCAQNLVKAFGEFSDTKKQ
jgi:hypothetical protein